MSDWADDRAREAVDAGDIGGELTGPQWSALHREFSAVLREDCIPRERVERAMGFKIFHPRCACGPVWDTVVGCSCVLAMLLEDEIPHHKTGEQGND